ncbi:MAG TPA: TRAP transporter small permease subunit [Thermohalobaculum sp.]|nr:TRAP transporter small permease subunit [Thermohalobaculum sp.]
MTKFVLFIDSVTGWFGKAFAWLILLMAFGMGYEVMMRYFFNAPTSWAFDMSYILYGTLFMMGGAYTLSRNAHVRGDFLYRLWRPRTQATVELVLYIFFFFPGVIALVVAGWKYAARSWRYLEVSVNSPAGIPVFQFKTMLVVAGMLLFIQGIAQICRCIICLRTGEWLQHEEDVEELEQVLIKQAAAGHLDDAERIARGRDDA